MSDKKKRLAIVCDGPFQLMSGFNVAYGYKGKVSMDLFLRDRVEGQYPEIIRRLNEMGIFDNVYCYKDTWRYGISVQRFFELLFPSIYIKKSTHIDKINNVKKYDLLYMSTPMTMQKALRTLNPNARLYWYDEGVGTYAFEDARYETTKLRNILLKIINRDMSKMNPQGILLNRPEFYFGNAKIPVKALPSNILGDEKYRKKVYSLFQYPHSDIYRNRRIVFMTWPGYSENVYDGICKTANLFQQNAIIRRHPADSNCDFGDVLTDQGSDMWELVCANQITDRHILVSLNSMACFTPNLIYGKEPYVIFTYRYVDYHIDERGLSIMDKFVMKLKEIYKNPNKIIVPESHGELISEIEKIMVNDEER